MKRVQQAWQLAAKEHFLPFVFLMSRVRWKGREREREIPAGDINRNPRSSHSEEISTDFFEMDTTLLHWLARRAAVMMMMISSTRAAQPTNERSNKNRAGRRRKRKRGALKIILARKYSRGARFLASHSRVH